MNSNAATAGLVLAGVPSPHAVDRVRRYCGLPWSGGPPETWAFRYFDAIETDGDRLEPTDVVSAAALHPGVSRSDLTFFHDRRQRSSRGSTASRRTVRSPIRTMSVPFAS